MIYDSSLFVFLLVQLLTSTIEPPRLVRPRHVHFATSCFDSPTPRDHRYPTLVDYTVIVSFPLHTNLYGVSYCIGTQIFNSTYLSIYYLPIYYYCNLYFTFNSYAMLLKLSGRNSHADGGMPHTNYFSSIQTYVASDHRSF